MAHDTGESHDISPGPTEAIWPPVKLRVQSGGLGSLAEPFLLVPSADHRPTSSSHIFPRFLLKGKHFPSALLFFVKHSSVIQAAASPSPLVRNTLHPPLWRNTTALISWVSKCCSPPLNTPHLPLKLLLHLRPAHRWETSRGGREPEAVRMKPLPFTQQNELPCGGGMVRSSQAALPL